MIYVYLAQSAWLNSTLGLIHFLSLRQDSKGAFIQLKKASLKSLLILNPDDVDIISLADDVMKAIGTQPLGSLPDQFKSNVNLRRQLDDIVLQHLINDDSLRSKTIELIESLYSVLGRETIITGEAY